MPRSQTEIGIALSFAGYSVWVASDVFAKLAGETVSSVQISAISFLTGVICLCLVSPFQGGYRQLATKRPWYQLALSLLVVIATYGSIVGVIYLSLADFYTIVFTGPLISSTLAALLLKERTTGKIWAAIVFGFLGVIIAIRFSNGTHNPLSALGVGVTFLASLSLSLSQLVVRAAPGESSYALGFWPRLTGAIVAAIFLACQPETLQWAAPGVAYSVLTGVLGIGGVLLVNLSLRYAPISIVRLITIRKSLVAPCWGISFGITCPRLCHSGGMHGHDFGPVHSVFAEKNCGRAVRNHPDISCL